jgi:hypothetical protein
MLMIYNDADFWTTLTPDAIAAINEGHRAFAHTLAERGLAFSGEALEPPAAATSVRRAGTGDWVITDGPFVETKEILGGYYVFEASDLDDALALAKLVPASAGVDIRPVKVM